MTDCCIAGNIREITVLLEIFTGNKKNPQIIVFLEKKKPDRDYLAGKEQKEVNADIPCFTR